MDIRPESGGRHDPADRLGFHFGVAAEARGRMLPVERQSVGGRIQDVRPAGNGAPKRMGPMLSRAACEQSPAF